MLFLPLLRGVFGSVGTGGKRQKTWGIDAIFSRASELLKEFQDVHKKVPQVAARSEDIRWKPPTYGLYKINFDGALFADQACAGLGVVIRDSEGQIIRALRKVRHPGSVDMVEALTASRAISFANELCIHQMVVEGDSLWVIKTINDARPSWTMFGHVIAEFQILSSIVCCSFNHFRREGNKLVHALAYRAVLFANIDVWLEDLPRDLDDVLQFDFQ